MRQIADTLRPLWLPGLNSVSGKPCVSDIRGWITRREFQVYSPVGTRFILSYHDDRLLCNAFASEIDRMSSAALESLVSVQPISFLPKSRAWAIVKLYYAAFFAAHSILRSSGRSLIQIEDPQAKAINTISSLYGQSGSVQSGFHKVEVQSSDRKASFTKLTGGGGSHELMWSEFSDWLNNASAQILGRPAISTLQQGIALKLDQLHTILNHPPSTRGSWLSYYRNQVNYKHSQPWWFPYSNSKSNNDIIFTTKHFLSNCENINIPQFTRENHLAVYVSSCMFIISLCCDMADEMKERSSTGKIFHDNGFFRLRKILIPHEIPLVTLDKRIAV